MSNLFLTTQRIIKPVFYVTLLDERFPAGPVTFDDLVLLTITRSHAIPVAVWGSL